MIVLGYHGCNVETAQKLLSGSAFELSNQPYDWLGTGVYFWEDDIERAYAWACERRADSPCVVGAVIELGICLDLTKQSGITAVQRAYSSFARLRRSQGLEMPKNEAARGSKSDDRVLRYLDRAVIDHLHETYSFANKRDSGRTKEFDAVRAMFPEGNSLYEGADFREKTHVQIAVRKLEQVLGAFRVPAHQLAALKLPDLYSDL